MSDSTITATAAAPPAPTNPKTGRSASALQGTLLLIGSALPVLGAVLLAPLLPVLSQVFKATPGSAALVPLIVTLPSLIIALASPFAGAIVDKVGRKRLLIIALPVYGIFGTAPLYLNGLGPILVSRAAIGLTEAAIMTCCTTLLGDYYTGRRREKYFGLQVLVLSLAATLFFALGGAIGATGWRSPFWIYAIAILLIVPMAVFLWQPEQAKVAERVKLPPIPWRVLLAPIVVTLFGGIVFYTLVVELPYLLTAVGVKSTAILGACSAIASLAIAVAAFAFRWLARLGPRVLLAIALGLSGVGYIVIWSAHSVPLVMVGAVIASLGSGILIPTLLTWAVSTLSFEERGRGTGLWTGFLYFGQFAAPLVVLAIGGAAHGSVSFAVGILGVVALVLAAICGALVRSRVPAHN